MFGMLIKIEISTSLISEVDSTTECIRTIQRGLIELKQLKAPCILPYTVAFLLAFEQCNHTQSTSHLEKGIENMLTLSDPHILCQMQPCCSREHVLCVLFIVDSVE
jgi:hypothetical protein